MGSLVLIFLVAFTASLFLTAAVRAAARRWGIVDHPDGGRKLHKQPVPLWGGVAVYGATVLGLFAIRFGGASQAFVELSTAWMIAAGFVCFVGGLDDRYNLPARVKLALQITSVLPIILLGHDVDRIVAFGYPIELGWLGLPLTVLWLVGCINALNLIDGMDGLASIIGLSTAAMLGVIAASEGHPHVAAMAMVLAAALAGFLLYNLPPASIFLGDSGSMVIGLTIGLLGIQGTLKTSATLAITAPAVVMTLPMLDVIAAMVRRRLTGQRFDAPDRLHIHHRLLDRGWNPWQVLCVLGALCLTTGAAATAATIFRRDALAWIAAMTLVVLMARLRLFGHDEFALIKGVVLRGWNVFRDRILARNPAMESETVFEDAPPAEMWRVFLRDLQPWNIRQVDFSVSLGDRPRRLRWIDPASAADEHCHWSLSVSMPGRDDEICELRIAGVQPIAWAENAVALGRVLKAHGASFANCGERFFDALGVFEELAVVEIHPQPHRKAA